MMLSQGTADAPLTFAPYGQPVIRRSFIDGAWWIQTAVQAEGREERAKQ